LGDSQAFGLEMRTDNISAIFGQVLREQRTSRGISQEDLALSANVDRTFVSQMERGIRQPSITTLVKLSNALGVAPSSLVSKMEKLLR
jgi:transcriptional regulator with XRE-family HTH domain